ncbi:MAG: hypothetical protein LIR50_05890 [Bacillota bacterium]|nr:hypothetical protein [Bacillota bacterium]
MVQALIRNNKVYCPNNHHNYRVKDYKAVGYKGRTLVEFNAECRECGQEFNYLASIKMDNTEYFNFEEKEAKEMREEQ